MTPTSRALIEPPVPRWCAGPARDQARIAAWPAWPLLLALALVACPQARPPEPVPDSPPSVRLISPEEGASLRPNAPATLRAHTEGAVELVEFAVDGVTVGRATAAPFELAWQHGVPGARVFGARAIGPTGTAVDAPPVRAQVEPLPTVSLSVSAPVVAEGDAASLTIARSGPATAALNVGYGPAGTAEAGADYEILPGVAVVPAGAASVAVPVRVAADALVEGREALRLTLAAGADYYLAAPSSATLAVEDRTVARVMPLGDSLTDGWNVPGGYRIDLWRRLGQDGVRLDLVGGAVPNGPAELPDRDHEGHSGWRIDEIDAQVEGWLDARSPGVILLLIGTNDILQKRELASAPDRLGALIDRIAARAPAADLLVATLPTLAPTADDPDRPRRVSDFNATIPGLVRERRDRGVRARVVDLHAAVEPADLADGVHLTRAGYDKVAAAWHGALARPWTAAP